MGDLAAFRKETRAWLEENCPEGAKGEGVIHSGSTKVKFPADVQLWMERMAERGWTVPAWPTEYGGGGLSVEETRILFEEMNGIKNFKVNGVHVFVWKQTGLF